MLSRHTIYWFKENICSISACKLFSRGSIGVFTCSADDACAYCAAILIGSPLQINAASVPILETIFGDNNPTGKLPFEIPSSMEAVENQNPDVADDTENPLFVYGYGLSYPE